MEAPIAIENDPFIPAVFTPPRTLAAQRINKRTRENVTIGNDRILSVDDKIHEWNVMQARYFSEVPVLVPALYQLLSTSQFRLGLLNEWKLEKWLKLLSF